MEDKTLGSLIRQEAAGNINALDEIFYMMKDKIFSFLFTYGFSR